MLIGGKIKVKKGANWIENLLNSKFFESCGYHREIRRNEKNMFCIDCNLCFCKHCVSSSSHCFHEWLQICKYVYHDVVRLHEIQKYLNCSEIQTYKINGEKAVHLNPRPQSKDSKTSKLKGSVTCEACGRHLQDLPNRFCSIACKEVTSSSCGNSLWQKCKIRLRTIDPCGPALSRTPHTTQALVHQATFFFFFFSILFAYK
ncbi:protein RGF1 INDUCIBLE TRANSCRIPTION FACTOR 1 isoform X2 [Capsicum annuum]|uniref:protein RGF1 INDUCIBLE TRANSCRIPTION FACTOR 1 isoform X2 n=1 Tax=Capsicum annuum TaxID=4072 RepID=UPI001FB106A1|nr:protein RGF1 INDUCIBLE TRANSCRIPTION FACTOR 1 isoform X2 [Capsicum annuum]